MRFELKIRKIEEQDIARDNPFPPDEDEYEMYLVALYEDISRLEGVSKVERNASIFSIETSNAMLSSELKQLLKQALTPEMLMKLRVVSVT